MKKFLDSLMWAFIAIPFLGLLGFLVFVTIKAPFIMLGLAFIVGFVWAMNRLESQ